MIAKQKKWTITIILLLLFLLGSSVQAQVIPAMRLYANWTPDKQLTSISGDTRYVDLHLMVSGNIQFWAVDIACTIGTGAELIFESISFPGWGVEGTDFTRLPTNTNGQYYSGSNLGFTVTRIGTQTVPLGLNGSNYSQPIATVRFRTQELPSDRVVIPTCRTMEFLDRDGNISARAIWTAGGNLQIKIGYALTGRVLRQGSRLQTDTQVTCFHDPLGANTQIGPVFTDTTGTFRFGGATLTTAPTWLRDYGLYRCEFLSQYPDVLGAARTTDEALLRAEIYFNLQTPQYVLLPVVLRSGDFVDNGTINFADLTPLTAAFGGPAAIPFGGGDANGDKLVNDADLAIVASNIGIAAEPLEASHVIYGLGRDYDTRQIFPNSKISWGTADSGQVTDLILRSLTRDFWPRMSPDNTEVAYVAVNARSGLHELFVGSVALGRGTLIRMPGMAQQHALAPSWSPDGNRIAFVCTPASTLMYNRGDICLINRADTTGNTLRRLGVSSEFFPPAWLRYDADNVLAGMQEAYVLIYPATDGTLRYYDLYNNSQGVVNIGAAVSATLDLPVVETYQMDGQNYLAYRYRQGGDPYLRIGTIAYDGSSFSGGVTDVLDGDHLSLAATTTGVDYYDLSPSLDIMFYYEYNYALANISGYPYRFVNLPHNDSSPLTWLGATTHYPDGFIGNPVTDEYGGVWGGNNAIGTMLHAQRATFDWIP